ncbi:MAG: hypothetical protein ABI305_09615 [Tepidiformaceae bacterium]
MRFLARITPLFALAACAVTGRGPGAPNLAAPLPPLSRVTRIVLTDVPSGAWLGAVQRADSVAALVDLYKQLADGWTEGAAPSPEIDATFYQDSVPVANLTLASGAFETHVGGRVLRRRAGPNEALAFVRLTGVPVKHGLGATGLALPVGGNARPPNQALNPTGGLRRR